MRIGFQDETVKRTMKYFGWGFQPKFFNPIQKKNVMQFSILENILGKNANGGTSTSLKATT